MRYSANVIVAVEPVTDRNREAVLALHVYPEQLGFVLTEQEMLAAVKGDSQSEVYAVLAEGAVVGFYRLDFAPEAIVGRRFAEPSCGLRSYFIDAARQGQGLGTAALTALIADLGARHPDMRTLNLSVNARNPAARRLYLAAGFTDSGDLYFGGPNGPQHVMTLTLM